MSLPVEIYGARITSEGALNTTDSLEESVSQGLLFYASDYFTVAAGATSYLLFDPTAVGSGVLVFQPPILVASCGPIEIDYRVLSDYSGGTVQRVANRFLGHPNVAKSVLTLNPTGTDEGTIIARGYIPSYTDRKSVNDAAAIIRTPLMSSTAGTQLLKLTNRDDVPCVLAYTLMWSETAY